MAPLVPRTKNVVVPPAGATAGPADSTPPRLVHVPVKDGSPEDGTVAVVYHSALSVPRHATVSVVPVMTAAGPPRHRAAPIGCQPAVTDRIHSRLSVPVPMNSGCAGVVPPAFGGATTAGAATIRPPSDCQPAASCGACTHSWPSVPSAPTATACWLAIALSVVRLPLK